MTVAFQFFNLNGAGADSSVAVDNVVVKVLSAPLNWRLAGDGVWDTGVTANWRLLSGGVNRVFTAGTSAVFDGAGGTITVAASGVAAGEVTVSKGGYVLAGGAISGAAVMRKLGEGMLVVESANTFAGGVVVEGDGSGEDCFCAWPARTAAR